MIELILPLLTAFAGHFSIVLKDVLFIPMFLYLSQFWHPLVLGLVGGIGGGVGELSAYLLGHGVGTLIERDAPASPGWVERLGLLAVLVSSLTPLPDSPVLLLLGSARYPVLPILALELVGKTILYTVMALTGGVLYAHLAHVVPAPWDTVLLVVGSLGVTLLVASNRAKRWVRRVAQKVSTAIRSTRQR